MNLTSGNLKNVDIKLEKSYGHTLHTPSPPHSLEAITRTQTRTFPSAFLFMTITITITIITYIKHKKDSNKVVSD